LLLSSQKKCIIFSLLITVTLKYSYTHQHTLMLPIQPHTVKLVIQYISPQITEALPPHLISTPLRQRHHYLQISPDNVIEYLCWPSPNNARIIELLDHSVAGSDEDQTDSYPTHYTSDAESTFAHVQIFSKEEGLRMLFQWDEADGWKYHDLQLMPFPASSFPTLQEAVFSNSAPEAELDRPSHIVAGVDHDNNIDDDPYWDAYGAVGDGLSSPLPPRSATASESIEGEDAYWAQYAAVQGCTSAMPPLRLPWFTHLLQVPQIPRYHLRYQTIASYALPMTMKQVSCSHPDPIQSLFLSTLSTPVPLFLSSVPHLRTR
jgi:hypothetical protein